jgi:molybdopterin converting factor small subunit
MKIQVRLFAGAAQVAGTRHVELDLAVGSNVKSARERLLEHLPQLGALAAVSLWANDTEMLDDDAVLSDGSELAMIPPVSGG